MKIQNNNYQLHIRQGFTGLVVGVSDPTGEKCIVVRQEGLPRLIRYLQMQKEEYDKANKKD